MQKLHLIDASAYIFRSYYALPPLTTQEGLSVGAVYGFSNLLYSLSKNPECEYLAIVFDSAGKNFRHEIYHDYKSNRKEAPEDLVPQFPYFKLLSKLFGFHIIELPRYEADDIIASYAKTFSDKGYDILIYSSDKDLMQLIDDRVLMFDPILGKTIDAKSVSKKFGVAPNQMIDLQALAGDASDNIPGIPGIGVKTAKELIDTFGDLDGILSNFDKIKQKKRKELIENYKDQALISKKLVTLKNDIAELMTEIEEFKQTSPDYKKLLEIFNKLDFKVLITRIVKEQKLKLSNLQLDKQSNEQGLVQDLEEYKYYPDDYFKIENKDQLSEFLKKAYAKGVMAIAISDKIGLAIADNFVAYIEDHALASSSHLRELLLDNSIVKVCHDAKRILWHFEIDSIPNLVDIQLVVFCLSAGDSKYDIKSLAQTHFKDKFLDELFELDKSKQQIIQQNIGLKAQFEADTSLKLYDKLYLRLVSSQVKAVYEFIEKPMVSVVYKMEKDGILIDAAQLTSLSSDLVVKSLRLEQEIFDITKSEFNINSPKQLAKILYDEMGYATGRKTSKGNFSTDIKTLEKIAQDSSSPEASLLSSKIIKYRHCLKLKSTYCDALINAVDPKTKRIHTSYSLTGAQTGRISSQEPNLQNIPVKSEDGRRIRQSFIASRGCSLISFDYSQIEIRILAEIAKLDDLQAALKTGEDVHNTTAQLIFNKSVSDIQPNDRRLAKAVNFGIMYGLSAHGLSQQLSISRTEAKSIIDLYFRKFEGIADYMQTIKKFCQENGYVRTLLGRKIHLPNINSANQILKNHSYRQAINAPIQGSAADTIKLAMTEIYKYLQKNNLQTKMLLQVHDELVFEAPISEQAEVVSTIKKIMEHSPRPLYNPKVPFIVEYKSADNWDAAH